MDEYGTEVWSSARWRGPAVSWLDERLAAADAERTGPVEQPRIRPWATVLTAPTTAGRVWFKACGPGTAFEVGLYEVLHDVVPDRVLAPLATDTDRGWLVLPDGGPTLDTLPADRFADVLVRVLPELARMQLDLAPHVDRLLAAGVADMRAPVMPTRFAEAVELIRDVPAEVVAMADEVTGWCERLAASPVPACLDHNDLHPDNVLIGDGTRFYDWGDSVVAHPFTVLLVTLDMLAANLGVPVDDPAVRRARDAYLEPFTDLAPHADLVHEVELARRVAIVARALTWHRAISTEPGEHDDAPRLTLESLLELGELPAEPDRGSARLPVEPGRASDPVSDPVQ